MNKNRGHRPVKAERSVKELPPLSEFEKLDDGRPSRPVVVHGSKPPNTKLLKQVARRIRKKDLDETGDFDADVSAEGVPANARTTDVTNELTRYTPRGRKLRNASDRPRPDLPSDAPVNRNRKITSFTLPPDLVAEFAAEAKARGVDRSRLLEHAIRSLLKKPTP